MTHYANLKAGLAQMPRDCLLRLKRHMDAGKAVLCDGHIVKSNKTGAVY